jgi:hypothetical protein
MLLSGLKNLYGYTECNPTTLTDQTGEAVATLVCWGACAGCFSCLGPGAVACAFVAQDLEEFAECYKTYWDLLPKWHKWLCAGVCSGCGLCVGRRLVGGPRPKPKPRPRPRPRPEPRPRPRPRPRRCADCPKVMGITRPIGPPEERCVVMCILEEQTLFEPCLCIYDCYLGIEIVPNPIPPIGP